MPVILPEEGIAKWRLGDHWSPYSPKRTARVESSATYTCLLGKLVGDIIAQGHSLLSLKALGRPVAERRGRANLVMDSLGPEGKRKVAAPEVFCMQAIGRSMNTHNDISDSDIELFDAVEKCIVSCDTLCLVLSPAHPAGL